jgi:tripartite-type tricarboxylate transporter receptor subunit TctC
MADQFFGTDAARITRRRGLLQRSMLAAVIAIVVPTGSPAQTYPNHPIRFIVPYAPGGGTDIVARTLAQKLTENLGQPVVVDNRSGAGGILGTELAAKSAPDGYTILLGTTGPLGINPSLYRNLPYDVRRDFAPISLIATAPHVLALHPSVPAKSVRELIAFAKTHPDQLTYSSGGTGGSNHLSGAMFNVMAGIRITHVPYRGAGPAVLAMVSGEVSLAFCDVLTTLPHVKSGRLRGIAVTGAERSTIAPELPTIAEAGVPGYESGVWHGVLTGAKTLPAIVKRLNAELVNIVRHTDMHEKLSAEGSEVIGSSPEQFSRFIETQLKRWAKIIAEAHITAEQ